MSNDKRLDEVIAEVKEKLPKIGLAANRKGTFLYDYATGTALSDVLDYEWQMWEQVHTLIYPEQYQPVPEAVAPQIMPEAAPVTTVANQEGIAKMYEPSVEPESEPMEPGDAEAFEQGRKDLAAGNVCALEPESGAPVHCHFTEGGAVCEKNILVRQLLTEQEKTAAALQRVKELEDSVVELGVENSRVATLEVDKKAAEQALRDAEEAIRNVSPAFAGSAIMWPDWFKLPAAQRALQRKGDAK